MPKVRLKNRKKPLADPFAPELFVDVKLENASHARWIPIGNRCSSRAHADKGVIELRDPRGPSLIIFLEPAPPLPFAFSQRRALG